MSNNKFERNVQNKKKNCNACVYNCILYIKLHFEEWKDHNVRKQIKQIVLKICDLVMKEQLSSHPTIQPTYCWPSFYISFKKKKTKKRSKKEKMATVKAGPFKAQSDINNGSNQKTVIMLKVTQANYKTRGTELKKCGVQATHNVTTS